MSSKNKQLIFIDDSGDPGFKFRKGSSKYLAFACIIFEDSVETEFASATIKKLKKELGWKQEREFKFHKTNDTQKEAFYKAIKPLNFQIRAIFIDKTKLELLNKNQQNSFYQDSILEILNRFENMRDARILLDGKGGNNYRKRAVAKLRKTLNQSTHRLEDFGLMDSKKNELLQLADMVVGAIRAKYDEDKKTKCDWTASFKKHIDDLFIK